MLIHGDMEHVLPTLEPTAIITDPVWPNAAVPLMGSEDPYGLFRRFVDVIPETVTRAAIILGCDSDPGILEPLHARLPFFRVAVLEYLRPYYKGRLLAGFDVAYFFGAPPGKGLIPGRCLARANVQRRNDIHPCPRRLEHVEWVVNNWSEPDDLVCDPFAGSGTTLLACKLNGRKAIGIEIDETHFRNAQKYLAQNPTLFGEEPA